MEATVSERKRAGIDFILRRSAELFPDRVALDDLLSGISLTYEQLRHRSSQLARAFGRLGIGKGDLVPYAFYNEHRAVETLFACCMSGAIAMPLNTRLSSEEARAYVSRYNCRIFVGNAHLAHLAPPSIECLVLANAGADELDYEALIDAESGAPIPPRVTWDDPYMMAMTGGTTGLSKAAIWGHGGCLMDTLSVISHMGIGRDASSLCLAPTFHAAGLGWGLLPVLWQAGRVTMPPQSSFDPVFTLDAVRRGLSDYLLIVPAMIRPLHEAWDGKKLANVRSVCVTSAPTPVPLRRKLAEMFPEASIVAGYGMTETFSMTIQSPGEFLTMPESVGTPSSVTRVRILDDAGREVRRGVPGRVYARTMAMSCGYRDDPANTAKAYQTLEGDEEGLEWMDTGDVGILADTGHLTLVDRSKDIIISGGENVGSIEVENVLAEVPDVVECAVVGMPDERWGERVVAALVMKSRPQSEEEVINAALTLCRRKLAHYKVPKSIYFLDRLPRTPFGKVAKREIVKQLGSAMLVT